MTKAYDEKKTKKTKTNLKTKDKNKRYFGILIKTVIKTKITLLRKVDFYLFIYSILTRFIFG